MKKEIHLELTLKCLFNCMHCSGSARGNYNHIEFSRIEERLGKLGTLKGEISELVLTGGEPLLRDDLKEIIAIADRLADSITLFTTGNVRGDAPTISDWQQYLIEGLDTAVFSVHSADQEVNDSFFRAPVFYNTLQSIKNAGAAGLKVQVNCVLTKKNISSLDPTIGILTSIYGAEMVRLLRFVSQGRGSETNDELYVDPRTCEHAIRYLKEKYGRLLHPEGFPSLHRCRSNEDIGPGCQFGTGFFYIDTEGYVLPCPAVKRNVHTRIGNIDHTPHEEIKRLFDSGQEILKGIDPDKDYFRCPSQASWKEIS